MPSLDSLFLAYVLGVCSLAAILPLYWHRQAKQRRLEERVKRVCALR